MHQASEKIAELVGFDDDETLNVGLAVREAVINAMLHGNKQDPGLKVKVELEAKENTLEARIWDEGNGFEPDKTPDPRSKSNLLRNSGRGLLLMEAFVDKVTFRALPDGGTEVTLIKRLPTGKKDEDADDDS